MNSTSSYAGERTDARRPATRIANPKPAAPRSRVRCGAATGRSKHLEFRKDWFGSCFFADDKSKCKAEPPPPPVYIHALLRGGPASNAGLTTRGIAVAAPLSAQSSGELRRSRRHFQFCHGSAAIVRRSSIGRGISACHASASEAAVRLTLLARFRIPRGTGGVLWRCCSLWR
jgi:hypothetical protein